MANIITGVRIICSVVLLFCTPLSGMFYVVYLTAGLTDMADGAIARRTNSVSEFGTKLDTFADFVFVVVCLIKLIPIMDMPSWIYIWIAIIALIKVINMVCGYIVQKKFVMARTVMNRIAGLLLFLFPLTLSILDLKCSAVIVCAVATITAVHEGYYIRAENIYR